MKIGIDIDGVITNMEEALLDYGTKYCFENNIKYEIDLSNYYEGDMFNISDENIEKFWNKYLGEYAQNYPTRKYASEVIKKLKVNNEIYIITARNEYGLSDELYGTMQKIVKQWLEKNKIEYNKIIFTQDKLKECKENKIDIMIEDSPMIIEKLKDTIKVFCFDATYNRKISGENIIRVYSWYDILSKLK